MFVSMRLGPLVRLIAGVALVAVLVFGVLVAGSVNSAPNNTTPTPAPPANSAAAAAVRSLVFHVVQTQGNGLNMRGCPGVGCARVGWIADGATFTATCSILGTAVNGDRTWLRGWAAGRSGYVSGYFLEPTTATMPACAANG
jgi:hypothetical protein